MVICTSEQRKLMLLRKIYHNDQLQPLLHKLYKLCVNLSLTHVYSLYKYALECACVYLLLVNLDWGSVAPASSRWMHFSLAPAKIHTTKIT